MIYYLPLLWIISLLLSYYVPIYNCKSTLLLGDSVDRFMMEDWCHTNAYEVIPWGDFTPGVKLGDIIKYGHQFKIMMKGRWNHPFICFDKVTNDSIASVHVFGSGYHGPYLYNISNNPLTDLVETPIRLNLSLIWYIEQFGYPDRVFLHTGQWDKQRYYEVHQCDGIMPMMHAYNDSLVTFYRQTHDRIEQILAIIGSKSKLGLRTAVWQKDKCEMGLLDDINILIKNIARERQLLLYDYDADVWSIVHHNRSMINYLYRDWMHPTRFVSFNAAEKLLGRRYSKYFYDYSSSSSTYDDKKQLIVSDMSIYDDMEVGIIKVYDSNIYYFSKFLDVNYSRRSYWNIPVTSLMAIYMGTGDMIEVDHSIHLSILQSSSSSMPSSSSMISTIPRFFDLLNGHDTQYYGVITSSDEKFIIDGTRHFYNITSCDMNMFTSLGFIDNGINIFVNTSYFWLHQFAHHGHEIPSFIYDEGRLLRCARSKEIFLIENSTRHAINSLQAFIIRGYDLEQVQPVPNHLCRFLFYIPLGNPLV